MTLGVDIGGTTIKLARVDTESAEVDGEVVTLPTPSDIGTVPDVLVDILGDLGTDDGVGVGVAGVVDPDTSRWRWMPHATGSDVDLIGPLQDALGVRVVVDNDVNMALTAEVRRGAGVGCHLVLMVAVGTGIGGAVAIDGRVERGRGALGEIGHMRVAGEPRCHCGAAGCWEAVVSGRVLDAKAAEVVGPGATAVDLIAAAAVGSEASAVVAELASRFASGLGNLILVLDPDLVLVGGAAGSGAGLLFDAALQELRTVPGALARVGLPPIVPARFGSLAGLIGAALTVAEAE